MREAYDSRPAGPARSSEPAGPPSRRARSTSPVRMPRASCSNRSRRRADCDERHERSLAGGPGDRARACAGLPRPRGRGLRARPSRRAAGPAARHPSPAHLGAKRPRRRARHPDPTQTTKELVNVPQQTRPAPGPAIGSLPAHDHDRHGPHGSAPHGDGGRAALTTSRRGLVEKPENTAGFSARLRGARRSRVPNRWRRLSLLSSRAHAPSPLCRPRIAPVCRGREGAGHEGLGI